MSAGSHLLVATTLAIRSTDSTHSQHVTFVSSAITTSPLSSVFFSQASRKSRRRCNVTLKNRPRFNFPLLYAGREACSQLAVGGLSEQDLLRMTTFIEFTPAPRILDKFSFWSNIFVLFFLNALFFIIAFRVSATVTMTSNPTTRHATPRHDT
jgi:hypothetical protein